MCVAQILSNIFLSFVKDTASPEKSVLLKYSPSQASASQKRLPHLQEECVAEILSIMCPGLNEEST
jgi:hypothetical protein